MSTALDPDTSSVADTTTSAVPARTTLPVRPPGPPPAPRATGGVSWREVGLFAGAAFSAWCTTTLLFGRLTSLSGGLGFVVVFFAVFSITYAILTALDSDVPAIVDRLMTVLMSSAAVVALIALASVILFVLVKGHEAMFRPNTYTKDLASSLPDAPVVEGGILHALVGTFIITGLAMVFTVPLGLACSVFLNETRHPLTSTVRTVVTAMTALPSILAGLLVYAVWILTFGFDKSGFAAAIAVSIVMLPIIVRAADVVLRLVPGNLREAAEALGAPKWRVVWHVVLPTARPGLTTAVILGVARGIGETAPILLTAGFTRGLNFNPTDGPMAALPLVAYQLVRAPGKNQIVRGFATAGVLMMLVLLLFTVARILGGRPAGQLSKWQARRAAVRSAEDVERFATRGEVAAP